jgi:hypothetical protein
MASWAEFERAAPELAAHGRRLLHARGDGEALLATVRADTPPRIHPINVDVVGEGLYAFLLKSAKRADLEADGRYALHTHQDPAAPDEFSVRGRVQVIDDPQVRARVRDAWPFQPDDTYLLVEFAVEQVILGLRGADEWPPRYTRWRAVTPA